VTINDTAPKPTAQGAESDGVNVESVCAVYVVLVITPTSNYRRTSQRPHSDRSVSSPEGRHPIAVDHQDRGPGSDLLPRTLRYTRCGRSDRLDDGRLFDDRKGATYDYEDGRRVRRTYDSDGKSGSPNPGTPTALAPRSTGWRRSRRRHRTTSRSCWSKARKTSWQATSTRPIRLRYTALRSSRSPTTTKAARSGRGR